MLLPFLEVPMERSQQIAAVAESEEERMLLLRVCDRLTRARDRDIPTATAFLSPREQALVKQILPWVCFYGVGEAERKVAYYLPAYLTEEDFFEDGPVACLRGSFYEANALSHRDVLGALMGAGIRRDTVGDICIHEKFCDIFVQTDLVSYLLDNLRQAGRQSLRLEQIPLRQAEVRRQEMKILRVTVSSLRLDSVLSAAFHLSRGAAAEAIRAGTAARNSLTCLKPDKAIAAEDTLSLRGKGKLRVLEITGETKKGRIALSLGIFQ